jgi:arylsulfatase A-like enzyme
MDRQRIARRLVAASGPAALWVATLEAASLSISRAPDVSALAWLSLATLVLSFAGCVVLALLLAAVTPILPGAAHLASRPAALRMLGGLALAVSAALHAANALLYVRLYIPLHAALALAVLASSLAAFAWLGKPRDPAPARFGRARTIAIAVLFIVALAASLSRVLIDPSLRATALEDSTQLARELEAVDALTGILDVEEVPVGQAALDAEILDAVAPQPMTSPSGVIRNANVLLITVDSMRADRWLAGGADRPMMPALERLAADSTRFSRAYAASCWTVHSMGALLLGKVPSLLPVAYLGVTADLKFVEYADGPARIRDPLSSKKVMPVPKVGPEPSLIDALNQAGYATGTVVPYIYYLRDAGLTADFAHVDEQAFRSLDVSGMATAHVDMVERSLSWLDERDSAKPFFLWLHFMEPHAPYEARDAAAAGKGASERYDSELRYVDGRIAALRAALEERGLWDRTLTVIHADHGEEFGEHGGTFHAATLYDETVRVPLLVHMPAQSGGRTVATPVSLFDLTPTLLDLVGAPSHAPFMGRSLRKAIEGAQLAERPIIMECDRFAAHKRGYLRWPFKLILDHASHTAQLYALTTDPLERDNLAAREPALLQGLTLELGALMRELEKGPPPGPL